MMTGYPMSAAIFCPSRTERTGSTTPGSIGSPASCMSRRAVALLPMSCITDGGGPMKVSPADSQISAKSGSSERKP